MSREKIRTRSHLHPSACAQTENRLDARHLRFAFEPNLPIDQVHEVEGNQVRLSEHRAPKATVDRYAEQMKAGAIFPAIVVNDRHELVDGNSRLMAARAIGRKTIAAYVCSDLSAIQARSLSVELNQTHGLSMTEAEIHAFATSAVEEGRAIDAKAYARMTGVKPATLTRWVNAKHFEMRARREGIGPERFARLSESARAALQVARLSAVFCDATDLAIDARVSAAKLNTLVGEANAAASEAEALAIIARAREARAEDIKAIAAGFRSSRRRSAGPAMHIGGLLRFEIADLLDVPPDRQADAFRRMSRLWQRLDGALARARVEWRLDDITGPSGEHSRPTAPAEVP
jgi:ParB-like chromosome segregation protein Spo0J